MNDGTVRQIINAISDQPLLQLLHAPKAVQHGSLALSEDLRHSFLNLEKTGIRGKDKAPIPTTAGMHLSSFTQIDGAGAVFWTYERYQLDRRLYVMPNLRKMNFAISRFSNANLEEDTIRATTAALTKDAQTGKRGQVRPTVSIDG